ncbi:hypothetical protein MRB53_031413 [Persea americana]|uniref:Uncharacterized protein n=1 Tax=Persea americana TaxID=3435 RepID=A0ACC2KNY9_PERAE|nr:hypothetical protein MRB53_031413 [Persea americana]|eukprot:TRINITY_DN6795_c0_g1_i1.p1 TRINITY_DN6795_c0_g1~~TRINITY_DN6795_c0_g1_i1.p1  ORF type:complete len:114 (-),score=11.82 TRINITY_DN6795_c0_g1_i1:668-1009(-)
MLASGHGESGVPASNHGCSIEVVRHALDWDSVTSVITLGMSYIGFENIINSVNFLYALGLLLKFASFVWLMRKHLELKMPFRVDSKGGVHVHCAIGIFYFNMFLRAMLMHRPL